MSCRGVLKLCKVYGLGYKAFGVMIGVGTFSHSFHVMSAAVMKRYGRRRRHCFCR